MQTILNKLTALWRKTDKTQLLRHTVQLLSFLLFPGLFLTVFNALKDVVVALVTGTFAISALSGSLITLTAVLGVTALWGRFFCGYLCTFGALQELLSFAGKRILPDRRAVPEKADKLLKYTKYGVLLAVVLLVWALQLPVDSTLSPWGVFGALLSGNMTVMAEAVPTVGFGLLLAILIVSLFVERAFCRYLCPLGALFTPLSAGRLFRIRRLETPCTGCQQCTRTCAMGVTVHEDPFVRSGECIDCMRCVAACRPQALRTAPVPAVAGTASALALGGLIQVGKIAVPEQSTVAAVTVSDVAGQVVSAEDASPATRYADGVYTGSGTGFRGVISAQVTVEGGRIVDVTILSSTDDKDFFQRAQSGVIPAILQAQSVNVSAVSGATWSSRGILEAVANALELDASALPEISGSRGYDRGSRPGTKKQEENGDSRTPPSGAPGSDRRQRQGKQDGQDQDESSAPRQRKQRKSGKNRS
ncbi:MAG: 4Fe-4S binding protein [Clostridia bacterium]|nr:4Fe-4S binding protein [Clostridia bacterium]